MVTQFSSLLCTHEHIFVQCSYVLRLLLLGNNRKSPGKLLSVSLETKPEKMHFIIPLILYSYDLQLDPSFAVGANHSLRGVHAMNFLHQKGIKNHAYFKDHRRFECFRGRMEI